MNKRKGLILGGVLLASAAAVCAIAVGSRGGVLGRSAFPYETQAVDLNTLDFDMRVEGSVAESWKYTKSYSEAGMVVDVTGGTKTDWHFGIAKWGFPTPRGGAESKDYYCEFVLELNVAGRWVSGENKSEVVLEAGGGGNAYKADFSANTQFTIGKSFAATKDTTDIVLSLGAVTNAGNENVFTAKIKKFVLKEGSAEGDIVNRVNFETASGFVKRWKAAHANDDGKAFCNAKTNVEELIYDYSALRPAERALIAGGSQNLTGKVINEPAAEASPLMQSNAWVAGEGNEAHAEVSVKSTEAWHSRIWIDLSSLGLETGKTYKLSFDIWQKDYEAGFELITQPLKWTNDAKDRYGFFNTSGYHEQEITIPSGGSLWFLAQLGNVVNEISVYNITVRSLELDIGGNSIVESIQYFAARYGIELN